jgi:hypothetical protein
MKEVSLTWVVAGLGAAGLFWGQVRGFLAYLRSVFIVSAEITGWNGPNILIQYCWDNYHVSKFGTPRLTTENLYIRPKEQYGQVALEAKGIEMVFWKGLLPLFISTREKPSDNIGPGQSEINKDRILTATYLRGTFNIRKVMALAAASYNDKKSSAATSRYCVIRQFGYTRDGMGGPMRERGEAVVDIHRAALKPLGWRLDEVGAPTQDLPFSNLVYPEEIASFIPILRNWGKSRAWCREHGIPWRMGVLLHGPAGTGKTSFVRAIAQDLDLPLYLPDISGLNNKEMVSMWQNALTDAPSVVLIEDLDRLFEGGENKMNTAFSKASLTMDCLLNCVSGVEPSDGILTFVTANDTTKIDPALGFPTGTQSTSRPGRLDFAFYFGPLSEAGRMKIAQRILAGHPEELHRQFVLAGDGETGAQFTKRCTDTALDSHWKIKEA